MSERVQACLINLSIVFALCSTPLMCIYVIHLFVRWWITLPKHHDVSFIWVTVMTVSLSFLWFSNRFLMGLDKSTGNNNCYSGWKLIMGIFHFQFSRKRFICHCDAWILWLRPYLNVLFYLHRVCNLDSNIFTVESLDSRRAYFRHIYYYQMYFRQ